MTPEEMNQVKEAQAANDVAVHNDPILETTDPVEDDSPAQDAVPEPEISILQRLLCTPIRGNHMQDGALLNDLQVLIMDETTTMADQIGAYDHMGVVMGLTDQPETTEEVIRTFVNGCKEEEAPVATDQTPPTDPNTVGQAAVDIAQASKDNPPAAKKARRKPVKGVMAKARQMLADGHDDAAILTALYGMYIAGGRDEKNAQDSAQLICSEVRKQANQKTSA